MTKELELLKSVQFNGVTLDCYVEAETESHLADDFWATREQIGRLLEYAEPIESVAEIHERNKERLNKCSTIVKLMTVEGKRAVTREIVMYNFKGLLEICRYSDQPKVDALMDFLWEVADEIRRARASEIYVKVRANEIESAKLLQRMVEKSLDYGLHEEDKKKLTQKIALMLGNIEVSPKQRPPRA